MLVRNIYKILIIFCLFNTALTANAKKSSTPDNTASSRVQSTMVIDANTGKILHSQNAHEPIYPASLTKLMTLYITFDQIKKGNISLNDKMIVSKEATDIRPLKLGVKPGETLLVKDAILSLIVKSANDSSNVLAEHISGSQAEFAKLMNKTANRLGMRNSHFTNAHGWHHKDQKTTASDLAKLSLSIKKEFPEFYPWFKNDSFVYKGKEIKGHNRVTREYAGSEGMKTGFTNPAGCNLVSTASRDGKSLLAVVTGRPSAKVRDNTMMKLLDTHFGVTSNNITTKKNSKSNTYASQAPKQQLKKAKIKKLSGKKFASSTTYKKSKKLTKKSSTPKTSKNSNKSVRV